MHMYGEILRDPCCPRFILELDGFNPFSGNRSVHPTWAVMLKNANLVPWLMNKPFFIWLPLLISGKKAVIGGRLDAFLEPLVEELQVLWSQGVMLRDAVQWNNKYAFVLKAMLLFTVQDFPAYGMIVGCVTKGYQARPVHGPETESLMSRCLHKNIYEHQAHQDLDLHHPMQYGKDQFRGEEEHKGPPNPITGAQIMERGKLREVFIAEGGIVEDPVDPVRRYGIKRVSILFRLPYWKVSFTGRFQGIYQG